MRGVNAKFGPRCFFCNLEGHFKSDCPQFWVAVADIKHPRHEEALSGVKASKARLLSEAEARRKDKPQELAAKKMQAVTGEIREPEPATAAEDFKIDYKAAARDALNRVQQELVTKEIEQKVKLELENEKLQERLNTFEATEFEETKTPSSLDMKLKVISGKRFGMVPQGSKIQSIISVAGHQVIRNLSEPSEFTLMHLDTYADYLRQVEPRTESRAVRALLTTGGPRMKKLHGRYLEVYGPYQIMLNVDGISIYTRTYVTTDDDQMGQIYLGEEELKVRRIGHDAMMEQDAVHIGYEADVTAHLLDTNGTKIGVTGLLDTGAVVSVMPIKTWEKMGFTREDLIPTNLRLAAANRGAIYVAGRTPITVLHMGGRDLWMSFLVVENLDDADQFILGRDFVRNFDVMIDLNNGLIRIRNPDRKYVKRPINRIIIDENKVPVFLDRKVKLQPGKAVVAIFRMRNLNSLSDSKQVCLVPNPNSQSSVILGRSFSVTRNGLCVSVLLNTLDTTVSIQRGKKLGYALPMRTDYEETQNLKKYSVKDCPYHANKDKFLKRINELKSIHKLFSMKSETDDGLSSCSNFPERPSSYELESDKPVLPEIEHLKGKIGEGDFKKLRELLNRNADVFSKHKADIGCCNFVEHEIELEEGAVPHREGARRMTPHKLEACRAEIEMLLEYDMIKPSKSPWACGVVMAKKKGGQLRFCCDFRYLNAVTIKDAYPIPRINESLSKLGDAKLFTTLDLGSAFWQVPLRKKDTEKTGFACELGLYQWKRLPFGLCNTTATFQRLMAQALTKVTKKYGNLVMCYVDDVVIATPTLEDHIDRLDEVFGCMKRAGLKCTPSKCEILRDSIKYLGRMVDRHGVRPNPEAVLTWKAPRTDTQLLSFLGFANYYREFIKGYADKVYPMQKLMRNKGKKFEWNDEAQVAFDNIKRELCEAPVLGMPTEKGMYVLDTDASVVAISGILHQEQEWNGRTVLRPIAYGSKVLSDTEMKYGAPKAEMFAVVTFLEKYRAYLGSAPFKLRVDNRALSWLKTYSMDQSYIGRWIVRLDGYHMIIEHRMRDKHQNADSLSKKTEFYERLEQKQANQAEIKEGFSFLDKETYEALPLTRWLDKSGHPIPGHPELPVEKAAEIKILSKEDPVSLDLLLRSNLVQQELSRMNINSLSLLDKTVQVTPQVMRMLGGLLEREVTRDDPEWTAAVASLTVSEKVKIMPSRRQHEENERDCRTIVQQLVSSIPQEILTSTSYGQNEQGSSRRKKTVTFVDQDKEGKKVEQNRLQDYLSGETNDEKNQRSQDQHPGQENLSGESEIDEKIPDEKQDLENKVLSGEFRWMRRRYRHDLEERAVSSTTSSTDDDSRNSGMDTYSDRNSSSGSELSELAIHTLLVETRARDLDREVYQDPDSDRYLIPSERVFDNAADDLETIAVSKRSISLLPQKVVVRTDLQPFEQETQPLAKIWCVKMEEDTHQPNELNRQMRVMKTYLKARYRLSDLLRAQRNDRMTSNLKRWIENGSPDKGDLEEDSYRILRQYFMQKEGRLYLNKDGIVACKRREEDRVLYKYNAIVLPQLYQTELLFRSHDQMGHQGIDKVYQRILKRFEWPGMKKACEKWVTACLSCQQVKDPRKLRFPLQSIESSEFNEVVQIDHQKICMTDNAYNQVLVMIDHFTKYAEAVPCITASAEETCDHLINTWIARHGCPMTFQSDNGTAFVGELTKELMRRSQVAQAHSTTYHPQTNGLVERQNRTLVSMLRVYCSRYMTDWDRYLPQVMGAYNSTQHSTTGVSPHMMLTGHEKSLPLTFFYPEYEGKKTSPQVYVRDVIRRQQELNDLCRRNTQQAQARQRKRFDKKAAGAKAYSVGYYVWLYHRTGRKSS